VFESLSRQLSSKDSAIQILEDELSSIRLSLQEATSPDKDAELLNAIKMKDELIDDLRSKLDALENDLKSSLDSYQQQTNLFDTEKSSLSNEIKTLQNNLESVRTEIVSKEQTASALSTQLEDMQNQLAHTTDTCTELKNQLEGSSQDFTDTVTKFEEIKSSRDQLQSDFRALNDDKLNLENECLSLKSKIQELQNSNMEMTASLDKSMLEQDVLQKQQSNTKLGNFVFDVGAL
jgi:chromosome segregation ATPase